MMFDIKGHFIIVMYASLLQNQILLVNLLTRGPLSAALPYIGTKHSFSCVSLEHDKNGQNGADENDEHWKNHNKSKRSKIECVCVVYFSNSVQCRPPTSLQPEHRGADDVIELSYYGGAKGQVLQIKTSPDGSVISEIVKQQNVDNLELNDYRPHLPIRVNSLLPSAVEKDKYNFAQNLNSIQLSAKKLVDLQQKVKHSGYLSDEQQKIYAENLEVIGNSAQKLVNAEISATKLAGESNLMDSDETVKHPNRNHKEHDTDENSDDSVHVNSPPDDASVAEAKPVGLAIAGVGGVASSKPVATAIVGPGGLAVAKPVATAIAGVSPSEVAGLGIPYPGKKTSSHGKLFNNE